MDGKFAKISPFQVDPDKIPQNFDLNDEDFLPAEEAEKAEDATPVKATLLFTTKTCPNCRTAIGLLERNGVEYRRLDAYEEQELALRFDIRTAPTLVVIEGENVERFEGVGAINRYCQTLANGESVTA